MKLFHKSMSVVLTSLILAAPAAQASIEGLFETGTNCVPTGRNINATYTVQGFLVGQNFADTTVVCPARVDSLVGAGPILPVLAVNVKDTSGSSITCKARITSADDTTPSQILDTQTSAGDGSVQSLMLDVSGFPGFTDVLTVECSVPNAAQVRSYGVVADTP